MFLDTLRVYSGNAVKWLLPGKESLENVTEGTYPSLLSQPTMGGREEGRKGAGAVALTGYYKGSSRRKGMSMVLRGAIYAIKRKHVVIKFL